MLHVLIAGVTGWTGAPLARAVQDAPDLELAGGIARSDADFTSVEQALAAVEADVVVDYTSAAAVRGNVEAALAGGAHVVVGSSGLTDDDYAEIDDAARAAGRGVIAAGRPSPCWRLTLLHAATVAAQHVGHWEVIDYGYVGKPDVPSGTARELASRLGAAAPADHDHDLIGARPRRAAPRSAARACTSLRLPGFVLSTEVVLAGPARAVARPPRGGLRRGALHRRGRCSPIRRVPAITGPTPRNLTGLLF